MRSHLKMGKLRGIASEDGQINARNRAHRVRSAWEPSRRTVMSGSTRDRASFVVALVQYTGRSAAAQRADNTSARPLGIASPPSPPKLPGCPSADCQLDAHSASSLPALPHHRRASPAYGTTSQNRRRPKTSSSSPPKGRSDALRHPAPSPPERRSRSRASGASQRQGCTRPPPWLDKIERGETFGARKKQTRKATTDKRLAGPLATYGQCHVVWGRARDPFRKFAGSSPNLEPANTPPISRPSVTTPLSHCQRPDWPA
jgi:hypothetical protein